MHELRHIDALRDGTAFLASHVPGFADMPPEQTRDWWAWHCAHNCACLLTEAGRIVALGSARPTRRECLANLWHYERGGDCVHIDAAFAPEARYQKALLALMEARFGVPRWIAYQRRHSQHLRILPYARFQCLLARQIHEHSLSPARA